MSTSGNDNVTLRFRVRAEHKTWNDKGPDLLRNWRSARATLLGSLPDSLASERQYWVREGNGPWRAVGRKDGLLEALSTWHKSNSTLLRVGVGTKNEVPESPRVYLRREVIRIRPLDDCSPETVLAHSLIAHAWYERGVVFAGGYVWKQVAGSDDWSDHAWGTAIDESCSRAPAGTNDALTDWIARMAAAGLLEFDYALGSRDGSVVYVAGDGSIRPSGADRSHLWHVHVSVIDHGGAKPSRQGGWPEVR